MGRHYTLPQAPIATCFRFDLALVRPLGPERITGGCPWPTTQGADRRPLSADLEGVGSLSEVVLAARMALLQGVAPTVPRRWEAFAFSAW